MKPAGLHSQTLSQKERQNWGRGDRKGREGELVEPTKLRGRKKEGYKEKNVERRK